MLFVILPELSLGIWIYMLLGRGGFWRIAIQVRVPASTSKTSRRVVAVIPARNEADLISESVRSLLRQNCDPPLHIIVVDDASSDGTAGEARKAAAETGQAERLAIVESKPLIPGWTGKLWALSQGVEHALGSDPDYLLFTDADIRHAADSVSGLLNIAEAKGCDLASLMVRLACESFAERALMPAFVFFFLQLYPPAWIACRRSKTAAAAGGCILIRPQALARIGGLGRIRAAIIDDCALARVIKQNGGRIWMGLASETSSVRSYRSFGEIGRMVSRTAFTQLDHSVWMLTGALAGIVITYLIPAAAVLSNRLIPAILGATAWLVMSFTYRPMVRFYRQSPFWCLALPVIALFYMGATIHSAIQYWMGKGGQWKGRIQDAPMRKRNMGSGN